MLWPPTSAQCARGYIRTAQKCRLRPYFAARAAQQLHRHYSDTIPAARPASGDHGTTLAVPAKARYNAVGVQQLSDHVHAQVFPGRSSSPPAELVQLSQKHPPRREILGEKKNDSKPIT